MGAAAAARRRHRRRRLRHRHRRRPAARVAAGVVRRAARGRRGGGLRLAAARPAAPTRAAGRWRPGPGGRGRGQAGGALGARRAGPAARYRLRGEPPPRPRPGPPPRRHPPSRSTTSARCSQARRVDTAGRPVEMADDARSSGRSPRPATPGPAATRSRVTGARPWSSGSPWPAGLPSLVVPVPDVPQHPRFAELVLTTAATALAAPARARPGPTVVACSTRRWLLRTPRSATGSCRWRPAPTPSPVRPWEVVERCAAGDPSWTEVAHPETVAFWERYDLVTTIRELFADPVVSAEGDLTGTRDYRTYAASFETASRRKWDLVGDWVEPGRVLDVGCATGGLLEVVAADPRFAEVRPVRRRHRPPAAGRGRAQARRRGVREPQRLVPACQHPGRAGDGAGQRRLDDLGRPDPRGLLLRRRAGRRRALRAPGARAHPTRRGVGQLRRGRSGRARAPGAAGAGHRRRRAARGRHAPTWTTGRVRGGAPWSQGCRRTPGWCSSPTTSRGSRASGWEAGASTRTRGSSAWATRWSSSTTKDYAGNWLSECHEQFCGLSYADWVQVLTGVGLHPRPRLARLHQPVDRRAPAGAHRHPARRRAR